MDRIVTHSKGSIGLVEICYKTQWGECIAKSENIQIANNATAAKSLHMFPE